MTIFDHDATATQEVTHGFSDFLRTRLIQTSQNPNSFDKHDKANEARIVISQLLFEDSGRLRRLVWLILGEVADQYVSVQADH